MLNPSARERRTLHEAVKANDVTAVERLLDGGAKVNAVDRLMWTALHEAAFCGTTEAAEVLVERGADLDARQKDDWTSLHLCSQQKSTAIARLLVESGADLNANERKGWTPLHICSQQGSIDIAKMLVAGKADLEAKTSRGCTPLHVAATRGHVNIVDELLEGGAMVKSTDVNGESALHYAVKKGHLEIVQTMLRRAPGDVINLAGTTGQTALHIAAIVGSKQMAQALVDFGARVDIIDRKGNAPLNYVHPDKEDMKEILAGPITIEVSDSSEDYSSISSTSSEPGAWTPDEPYGSERRMLKAIRAVKPGQDFGDDYVIAEGHVADKPHLFIAQLKFEGKTSVVLKFYWNEEMLENTVEVHSLVAHSEHVCKIQQTLRTRKTGRPPCIAFEKGRQTLRDWLEREHSIMDRKWCLHQVLIGLKDMHAAYIVHSDVKPSNVMFFPQCVRWKLIDLDGARKAGKTRAVCFTTPYAAPELLRVLEEGEGEDLPISRPSYDIWSFGILAYEVLTGERMFDEKLTEDEICEIVLDGRVEERLGSIVDKIDRDVVANLLKFDPSHRWTAKDALQHGAFAPSHDTTDIQKSTS